MFADEQLAGLYTEGQTNSRDLKNSWDNLNILKWKTCNNYRGVSVRQLQIALYIGYHNMTISTGKTNVMDHNTFGVNSWDPYFAAVL